MWCTLRPLPLIRRVRPAYGSVVAGPFGPALAPAARPTPKGPLGRSATLLRGTGHAKSARRTGSLRSVYARTRPGSCHLADLLARHRPSEAAPCTGSPRRPHAVVRGRRRPARGRTVVVVPRSRPLLVGLLLLLGLVAAAAPAAAAGAATAWTWPLAGSPEVVRPFAPGPTPYSPGHRGVDLAGVPGQPVLAAGAGRVAYAGLLAGRGVVTVVHGAVRTTYEPVTAVLAVGALVDAGEQLGVLDSGHPGCPLAACLHWGLLRGDTYLDPLRLVRAGPVRLLPLQGAPALGARTPLPPRPAAPAAGRAPGPAAPAAGRPPGPAAPATGRLPGPAAPAAGRPPGRAAPAPRTTDPPGRTVALGLTAVAVAATAGGAVRRR